MIDHETNIDTVAIQLDFYSPKKQRDKFELLANWIRGRRLCNLKKNEKKSNNSVYVYDLRYGNSKLATLHTGFTNSKYYIRIRFAGLKCFNKKLDDASCIALMTICSLLNTTSTPFKFVELDVAIDMHCNFYNVLVVIPTTKRANNVQYNPLGYIQYFNGVPTSYIENYSDLEKKNHASMRFYLYDKTSKENLDESTITRAELKLQNRFFLKNGFSLYSIMKAFDKYSIVYFQNYLQTLHEIKKFNNVKMLDNFELNKLEFNYYKIDPNPYVIENFIWQVQNVYVDFWGNVVMPSK